MATKAELEQERDELIAKLEQAREIIDDALGYDDADEGEGADEDEDEDGD
jgi:hypothetical protein